MMSEHKERQTGFKGVLYLLAFMLLTAVAVVLQLRFRGFEGPLSDNLLILVLINANFLLLAAVIVMIARSLWKLSIERKQRVLGARFRTKLVTAFVSLSFIPPVLLFIIGSGMFTSSIERLFNLRVENSLKASRSVAQAYYDLLEKKALVFGREISRQITEEQLLKRFEQPVLKEYLARKAVEYDLGGIELITASRERMVTVVTGQFPAKTFNATSFELGAQAVSGGVASSIIELGKRGQIVRTVVPLQASAEDRQVAALISISYYVPENLASKAAESSIGYSQYRALRIEKEPIKLAYRLGFLAVTLSLLLAAIWVALRVAAGITVPIQKLAEGTAAIAAGRFDYHIDEAAGDEIGVLVASFNKMTNDLKHSRERLVQEVAYKETILSNIDTGVVSMDRAGRITTINRAASDILSVLDQDVLFKRYDEAFAFIELGPVRKLFRRLEEGPGQAEEELSLTVRGRVLTLRMRVTTLQDGGGALIGSVITFDDLTELLRAKKAETWQDVARRIAHEFKNPLTPIKLSAERLRKKHAEGAADFDAVFDECSRTIVLEADGLRKLVDEFANFARMPSSNPVPQQLHLVLESVIALYAGAHKDISFERRFQADMPDVLLDREQVKRVFINLFENAVEAMGGKGTIWVTTAMNAAGRAQVEVADSGPGIAPEDVPRVFEPDFSRKKTNGGLGLAIVHKIIADHGGSIRFERNMPTGARFIMEFAAVVRNREVQSS
jgi:two-component system nitrogen regulation sensor histidine kinase NtrY